ncbi:efflux RND transporter periplasmic adaptor subunit [Sorangium sp. So ce1078]|uniref:HlyD family secretion protein n=1 Tax=Sorangium sp. So ce1078 TaxID=3133329 RepID=UPI003F62886B
MAVVSKLEHHPTGVPTLRPDLKFFRGSEPSVVLVYDPVAGTQHALYELDCLVAHEMDGMRDLDQLTSRARRHFPDVTRQQVASLIEQIAALGLLVGRQPATHARAARAEPPAGTIVDFDGFRSQLVAALERTPEHRPGAEMNGSVHGDGAAEPCTSSRSKDDDVADARPATSPTTDEPVASVSPEGSVSPAEPALPAAKEEPPPAAPPPGASADAPPETAPPPGISADAPPEPAGAVPSSEAKDRAAARGVEEQPAVGVAWVRVEAPWWTRPAARRLLAFCVAAVLLGALAVIPYPLYVTEPCLVLPFRRVEVRAHIEGLVAEILVDEGDRVRVGDVIARLDAQDLDTALLRAQAEVERRRADLAKVRAGARKEEIDQARASVAARSHDVQFAEVEAKRRSALFAAQVETAERKDSALRDLAVKRKDLAMAEAELRLLLAGSRQEEVDAAVAELELAKIELQDLERRRERLTIVAPSDGIVVTPRLRERVAQSVRAGDTVCEVEDLRKARIEIFVPEREMDVVALGQPTAVKVQSYPLMPFRGTVDFISKSVEERNGEQVIRVMTEVDNQDGRLLGKMTGYGEINTGDSSLLWLALRRAVRWVRIRFLI